MRVASSVSPTKWLHQPFNFLSFTWHPVVTLEFSKCQVHWERRQINFIYKVPGKLKAIELLLILPHRTELRIAALITYSKQDMEKGDWRFVRYSPIICLLRPFLDTRKRATLGGEPSKNFFLTRYVTPTSGFLLNWKTNIFIQEHLNPVKHNKHCWLQHVYDY